MDKLEQLFLLWELDRRAGTLSTEEQVNAKTPEDIAKECAESFWYYAAKVHEKHNG